MPGKSRAHSGAITTDGRNRPTHDEAQPKRFICWWCLKPIPQGESRLEITDDGKIAHFHQGCGK